MSSKSRPPILAELKRRVLIESGHRCAIQTCRHETTDIHHIVPWSQCKKHEYDNLIALCPNCHRRAESGGIDRKSLRIYKTRLAALLEVGLYREAEQALRNGELINSVDCSAREDGIGYISRRLSSEGLDLEAFEFEVEYPEVFLKEKSAEDAVNSIMLGYVNEEKSVVWGASRQMRQHTKYMSPHRLNISFDISTIGDALLSVKFASSSYTGGGYSNNSFRTFNIMTSDPHRLLELSALGFGKDISFECLASLCTEQLSEQLGAERERVSVPHQEELFCHFNILRAGVMFSFDEHTISGKWLGAPSVLVPYCRIESVRQKLCQLGIEVH